MIKTKDTEIWGYVKSHFPTLHLFKNVYLVRNHTYNWKISRWALVIVESEEI